MKKALLLGLIFIIGTLSACDTGSSDLKDKINDDTINQVKNQFNCEGYDEFIVVEGVCIPLADLVSKHITIDGSETIANHMNSVELMNDFVADLTGSTGLAVVSRDQFNAGMPESEVELAGEENSDTENLIVKLNEDGFFEQVSFSDDNGLSVDITSNPLALEVYGEFTVVIFEVDMGYNDPNQEFTQKLYDSLYAGGIYLIHNETGKLFATKDVDFSENTYSYFEDHSRMVQVMVTINQPIMETYDKEVLDEFGKVVLDESGNPVLETITAPILDTDGNPVIFTEGPIKMETIEAPVIEYFEVERLDDDGIPVLDENGKPIFDIIEEPVLDESGNPKIDIQTVPMLDEDGNVIFVEEFEVEIFIDEQREIIVTDYTAIIADNPLSVIAQRFVDKIMSEYYNWNYYRVSNYRLEQHSFANNEDGIFYMEWTNGTNNENSQILKKLSFDSEFDEIVIEDFLDLTKAGFDQCELIIDPINNNIICKEYDSNLAIYSETNGKSTIPDSETLQPISFPNGELYFFDSMDSYVDELGYNTTALYTITSEGGLEAHYIELGERNDVCYGECFYGVEVNTYTPEGIQYGDYAYADMVLENGDASIKSADLKFVELGEFDSSRQDCTDSNGCWFETYYSLLDDDDNVITTVYSQTQFFPGETAPSFVEQYRNDENIVVTYQQEYIQFDKVCENEIGCSNNITLLDESINQNGLWLSDSVLVTQGETLIQDLVLSETNTAVYNYEKVLTGDVCQLPVCTEYVETFIYNQTGERIAQNGVTLDILQGETIPLRIEYTISDDTTVVYQTEVCTISYGCSTPHQTQDGNYFDIYYQQGDVMYHTLTFAETDKNIIISETLVRDVCMELDGCYVNDIIYEVKNDQSEILYLFETYGYIEWGNKAPFKVDVTIDELSIRYQQEGENQDKLCNQVKCESSGMVSLRDQNDNLIEIGWANYTTNDGDKMIQNIELSHLSYISSINEKVCNDTNGCILRTDNYIIIDEFGVEYQNDAADWGNQLPVKFDFGQVIPSTDDFEATFLINNIEYNKRRINVQDFIYNMQNTVILDQNLFLIESQSWVQGDDNFILTFNDVTGRYSVKYTNMSAVLEITEFNEGYIAINDDETSIIEFSYNQEKSTEDFYFFDVKNLTEGLQINGVNDLIVDYDGSIFFNGVDNFIREISGSIDEFGTVSIDTEVVEHTVVRIRPIN